MNKAGKEFLQAVREIINESARAETPARAARLAVFGCLTLLNGSGESFVDTPLFRVVDTEGELVEFGHHDLGETAGMYPSDIDNMSPGRQMDTEVAVAIGRTVIRCRPIEPGGVDGTGILDGKSILGIPLYSARLAAFDLVKREFERRGWEWECKYIGLLDRFVFSIPLFGIRAEGRTVPLAGCRAFLKAIRAAKKTIHGRCGAVLFWEQPCSFKAHIRAPCKLTLHDWVRDQVEPPTIGKAMEALDLSFEQVLTQLRQRGMDMKFIGDITK